jgi:hypothetical protein
MRKAAVLLGSAVALVALAAPIQAQVPESTVEAPERPRIGVGIQSSYPAWGLSGIYDLSDNVSAQAIAGMAFNWTTVSGRALVRFNRRPFIDPYGYGMVGFWRWTGSAAHQTQPTFGAGAGVDVDLRILLPELPPIFANFEVGIGRATIGNFGGMFLAFGSGLHYRF